MGNREYYIRFRIYVNYAGKADKKYPRRLKRNLQNLHNNINNCKPPLSTEIKNKTFIPKSLTHVNPAYYYYIAYIAEYFECIALWETTMIKGSIQHINTFTIWGYGAELLLAYHYITKVIDSLDAMRYNLRREYREKRIQRVKKGFKPYGKETATERSSKFFYKSIREIQATSKELLDKRKRTPNREEKLQQIIKEIRKRRKLDFRKYPFKKEPPIKHAYSTEGKFQNQRLIKVNF